MFQGTIPKLQLNFQFSFLEQSQNEVNGPEGKPINPLILFILMLIRFSPPSILLLFAEACIFISGGNAQLLCVMSGLPVCVAHVRTYM